MKKQEIRCIETRFTNVKQRDRIWFNFVTGDDIEPPLYPDKPGEEPIRSVCVVKVGDIDLLSGQMITQELLDAYYKLEDAQIRKNLNYQRYEFTKEEQAGRRKIKKKYMAEFREGHGHFPSEDDVKFYMEMHEPERWNILISTLVEKEDKDDMTDREKKLSIPLVKMDSEENSAEMRAMQEVAASLTGRLEVVWEAMLQRAAGGTERLRFKDLADMWDVSQERVSQYRKRIERMIKKRAEELRKEEK